MVQFRSRPVCAVYCIGHHDCAQSAAAFQLNRITMWIMPNRQSLAGDKPSIERERNSRRPFHGAAITAKTRFPVIADRVMPSAFVDWPLSVLQCFFAPIPYFHFRLEQ